MHYYLIFFQLTASRLFHTLSTPLPRPFHPLPRRLSINVHSKMLVLNCLVLGEAPENTFPVEIDATKSVGSLKKSIKEEKTHAFQHVDANTLTLWKVSIPYSDINTLGELPAGEALIPVKKLCTIFPNHEVRENIDVIIKPPEPPTGK